MLEDDSWVPTFPNARYMIQRTQCDYANDEQEAEDVEPWLKDSNRDVLSDSIRPLLDAGLVDLVSNDYFVCDEVKLIPIPGHTIGYVTVSIESKGETGLITGNFTHDPCQLAYPE